MSLLPLGPSSVSSSLGLPSALSAPVGARNVRTGFSQVVFITADVAGGQSTTEIFLTSDRFKMFGVNAKSKTTEMIKVHPFWNRTFDFLVHVSVCQLRWQRSHAERSVAAISDCPSPSPATVILSDEHRPPSSFTLKMGSRLKNTTVVPSAHSTDQSGRRPALPGGRMEAVVSKVVHPLILATSSIGGRP